MSGTQAINYSDFAVKNAITSHATKANAIEKTGEEVIETLGSIAEILKENNRDADVNKLLELATQVAKDKHHIHKHKQSLQSYNYHADGSTTNFKTELTSLTQAILQNDPFDAERDPGVISFKEYIEGDDIEQAQDEQIDEDIMIEGHQGQDLARNVKCPMTLKSLLEIDEPVQDNLGFVYEKAAILQLFNNRNPFIRCPVAGTSHNITKEELVPARAVIAAKKRAARNQRNRRVVDDDEDEDVIEV